MMGKVQFLFTLLVVFPARCWSSCTIDREVADTKGTQAQVFNIASDKSLQTCKDICLVTDACVAGDINPTNKICNLYNAQTTEQTEIGRIFFTKSCTADPVIPCTMNRSDNTRGGHTFVQLKLISYDQCSSTCLFLTNCTGVSYSGGSCNIYTGSLQNTNTGDTPQGIKQPCLGEELGKQCCMGSNTNLNADGGPTFSVTQTVESCENVCVRTSSCVAVAYKDGVCYIYTSATSTTTDSLSVYSVKTCSGTVPPQGSITLECVGAGSRRMKQAVVVVAVGAIVGLIATL